MHRLATFYLCSVGLVFAVLCIWQFMSPSYVHRYRTTVEMEVGGNVYSGTGVAQALFRSNGILRNLTQTSYYIETRGTGAFVDMGPFGVVVALINVPPAQRDFKPRPLPGDSIALAAYYGPMYFTKFEDRIASVRWERGSRTLPEASYPAFVWLRDPKDRESAVPVLARDMGRVIDPSARVKSVTVELTSAPFSEEIFEKIPWLRAAWEDEKKHGISQTPRKFRLYARNLVELD